MIREATLEYTIHMMKLKRNLYTKRMLGFDERAIREAEHHHIKESMRLNDISEKYKARKQCIENLANRCHIDLGEVDGA